jgi:hypothetical protein
MADESPPKAPTRRVQCEIMYDDQSLNRESNAAPAVRPTEPTHPDLSVIRTPARSLGPHPMSKTGSVPVSAWGRYPKGSTTGSSRRDCIRHGLQ